MRRLYSIVAIALLQVGGLSTQALADKVDISTVSCSQLLAAIDSGSENDKSGMGGILYWIAGYVTTDEQGSVVDFDALGKDFEKILAGCKAKPKVGVLTIATKVLGENATAQGNEAIDLATMTCEAAVKSSKDEEEGLGFILMWIAGYHASDSEYKVFDTEEFVSAMEKVGEYCGAHPSVGLLTASEEFMSSDDSQ
jgi:acid stress chaperone HdeB